MKHWKTILCIFIGLTLLGLFLPLIVTQVSLGLDLGRADSNEIGDTIGGILGPYFSFIGSCLLAYTIYLQIEQRIEDKRKDFEKVIFEDSMVSLNKLEVKIHELDLIVPEEKSSILTGGLQHRENLDLKKINFSNKYIEIYKGLTNTISFFNENNIIEKGYQRIMINKIENLISIYGKYELNDINNSSRIVNCSSIFFKFKSIEKYDYVKDIINQIKILKSNYQTIHDPDFQKNEIIQLNETLVWLGSFEVDLKNYFKLKSELPFAFDFGDGSILNDDNRETYNSIKTEIKVIEDKYNLNNEV